MKTNEEYVATGGKKCPFCGCMPVGVIGQIESNSEQVWQTCKCAACGSHWLDKYALVGFELIEDDADLEGN